MIRSRRISISLAAMAGAILAACGTGEKGAAVALTSWDAHVGAYLEAYFAAHPDAAVNAGRHEFDGKLPDWSAGGLTTESARLKDWRARTAAIDSTPLDASRKLERQYLIAQIDRDLWWLEKADGPHRNPAFYTGALDPDPYLTRTYAPLADRMKSYTTYARSIVTAAAQMQANLKPPLARTLIDRGRNAAAGFASFYASDIPKIFAAVTDAQLQANFKQANDSAIVAMKALAAWFDAQRKTQTENFALGADLFRDMIYSIERVDTPLDELERVGKADLDRNLAALKDACAKFAPGASVADCTAQVLAHKPAAGPVEEARQQLVMLRKFIVDSQIVSIPGTEEAKVADAPEYARDNGAYTAIPGPYEKNQPTIYYIAPPDPKWSAKEQAEYIPSEASLLYTSVHEVWPGHFLQFLHANRSRSKFGQVFVGYAYAEGWAHYSEEMMWEAGLGADDPEQHVGQLMEALLRNVRFISAIGLHTKGMTVAESEKMFREQAYQDPGNARQQAARGTYDPEYLDYTMGKLMIRKLRADWTAGHGGRASWKEFHDQFLSYGGPPIPLVREAMMGAKGPLF